MTNNLKKAIVCGVAGSLLLCVSANAQLAIPGNTAMENVSAAAVRSPGNMVSAGVGRAKNAFSTFRAKNVITETQSPISPHAVFYAQAVEIIFKQINDLLFFLHNLSLIQAGLDPIPLPDTTTGETGGTRDPRGDVK